MTTLSKTPKFEYIRFCYCEFQMKIVEDCRRFWPWVSAHATPPHMPENQNDLSGPDSLHFCQGL